jgi:hypothetical protein
VDEHQSELPVRWVYDGRTLLGSIYAFGKRFRALKADGKRLGVFTSLSAARDAVFSRQMKGGAS